jgi:hypothetical protein
MGDGAFPSVSFFTHSCSVNVILVACWLIITITLSEVQTDFSKRKWKGSSYRKTVHNVMCRGHEAVQYWLCWIFDEIQKIIISDPVHCGMPICSLIALQGMGLEAISAINKHWGQLYTGCNWKVRTNLGTSSTYQTRKKCEYQHLSENI